MLKLRALILDIFKNAGHEKSPEAEADLILFHAFRRSDPRIHNLGELRALNPQATSEVSEEALRVAEERVKGIPLQHIVGEQFFYEHDYFVDDSTLIPRQETEILIHEIIQYIEDTFGEKPFRFAELGIGSGILSCELLSHFKNASGMASEVSALSIALARQNLSRIIGPDFENRISILEPENEQAGFEIFQNHGLFDLVFSNPPYVSIKDEIEKEVLDHEPSLALFPKVQDNQETPNYFYENFLLHHSKIMSPKGNAFFEVPHERALKILANFHQHGFKTIRLIPDLTGRHRVLQAGF